MILFPNLLFPFRRALKSIELLQRCCQNEHLVQSKPYKKSSDFARGRVPTKRAVRPSIPRIYFVTWNTLTELRHLRFPGCGVPTVRTIRPDVPRIYFVTWNTLTELRHLRVPGCGVPTVRTICAVSSWKYFVTWYALTEFYHEISKRYSGYIFPYLNIGLSSSGFKIGRSISCGIISYN